MHRYLERKIVAAASLAVLAVFAGRACGGDDARTLLDLRAGFDATKVATNDAKCTLAGDAGSAALVVATGHAQPWPGVTLVAPEGRWDLSRFGAVELDVTNLSNEPVQVFCRVDNPGADGVRNCVTGSIELARGGRGKLRVPLPRRMPAGLALFGMRGYPEGWDPKGTLDPSNVTQLVVFVSRPKSDHRFEILDIRATQARAAPAEASPAAFFPCIDTFGQYIHRDWPGKVHSPEELQARRADEEKELAAKKGPEDWNRFGGWHEGPALAATGRFRVEKYRGKWWLVDPEGKLFFSHGIDCGSGSPGTVTNYAHRTM